MKYDQNYLSMQNSNLNSIKQISFTKINEYFIKLKEVTDEIGRCKNWSNSEVLVLLESKLNENLTFKTRIKMVEIGKHTVQDILEYLENIENIILSDSKLYTYKNIKRFSIIIQKLNI
ncbi:hypothetical protein DMUE_2130 [Dictyocoela muelleri]|nr:hypothetical protein DMUE_2130 [Dictyocoela muelleri]